MCGIFGILDSSKPKAEIGLGLSVMAEKLHHRGPDSIGTFASDGIGVGNTRLSIIDIEGGAQPFYSSDNQVILVQNGEIYNYLEIKKDLLKIDPSIAFHSESDTEVLLQAYLHFGLDFVQRLNGMFSIAVYDRRTEKLHLVRDRFGIKPLYISSDDSQMVFASEICALSPFLDSQDLCQSSVYKYFLLNYVPSDHTIYPRIESVTPGYIYSYSIPDQTLEKRRYYDLDISIDRNRSYTSWMEELDALISSAVGLRMRSDVPYGSFLSGGIDSTTIAYYMSKIEPKFRTFFIGFEESLHDESNEASIVSQILETNHLSCQFSNQHLQLWPKVLKRCGQPHGDTSFIPTFLVCELASKHVKVALSGDGADEIFGGYDRHRRLLETTPENLSSKDIAVRWISSSTVFEPADLENLFGTHSVSNCREYLEALQSDVVGEIDSLSDGTDVLGQYLLLDLKFLLAGNNLAKPDRMGMAQSLEARVPFLDHRIVELAFSMPAEVKISGSENKRILRDLLEKKMNAEISRREKKMFTVPFHDWLQGEFLGRLRNRVLNSRVVNSGLFCCEYIDRMFERHAKKEENNSRKIRALAAFVEWSTAGQV